MATSLCTVSDKITAPGAGFLENGGTIEFRLNQYDFEDAGEVIANQTVRVPIGPNGAFTADLWPNHAGERASHYDVTVIWHTNEGPMRSDLGPIQVPNAANSTLTDLLDLPGTIEPSYWTKLDAAGVKQLYESNANTNAYTDAEKTKAGRCRGRGDRRSDRHRDQNRLRKQRQYQCLHRCREGQRSQRGAAR